MINNIIYLIAILMVPFMSHANFQINNSKADSIPKMEGRLDSLYSILEGNTVCYPDTPSVPVMVHEYYDTLTPLFGQNDTANSSPIVNPEDDRAVFWLHGLNGNEGAWSWASGQFSTDNGPEQAEGVEPRRIVNSAYLNYSNHQSTGIITAGANFRTEFSGAFPDESELPNRDRYRSIAIGHSQGGLMLRALDYQYSTNTLVNNPDFGGFITFCTPNQGAHLVERGNEMIDQLKWFSTSLAEGQIETLDDRIPGWLQFFGINMSSENISDLVGENLFSFLGTTIANMQLPPITESYAPGNPSIQALNTYETTMEDVLAVASERPIVVQNEITYTDSEGNFVQVSDFPVPLSWATLEYFINPPNHSGPFEAHTREDNLAAFMYLLRLQYHENQIREETIESLNRKRARTQWSIATANTAACLIGCAPCCVIAASATALAIQAEGNATDANENAIAFGRGVKAFDDFDVNYRTALGLRTLEENVAGVEQICECTDIEGFVRTERLPVSGNCDDVVSDPRFESCERSSRDVIEQFWLDHPSDGVVRLSSQMEIPQSNRNPVVLSINHPENPVIGSTHMAIRNDENGRRVLTEIFNGVHGIFFETEVQQ